ncbi:hypothetical protein HpHA70_09050 [Helicobacter pylori]
MLFDSLFSINEQQKAKAWSDFFKELKKDMKEIYNKFGGNAEWTTFLTRFSNDLSRASNYAEFETLQSVYSKELEELQQTITTNKTQQQLLEQDNIDFELQSALQNDLKDLEHLSDNQNKDDEEQTIQKSFEQDLDDLQNDKLNLEIKEFINKQDDKNHQNKEQLNTETSENQNNLTQNNANVNEMVKNTTNDNLIKDNNIKQNNIIDNNNVKNNNDLSFLDDEPIDFNQGNHSVDFNSKKSVKNNTEKKPLSPKLQAFENKSKQNIQNALTKSKELKNNQSLANDGVSIPMEMSF